MAWHGMGFHPQTAFCFPLFISAFEGEIAAHGRWQLQGEPLDWSTVWSCNHHNGLLVSLKFLGLIHSRVVHPLHFISFDGLCRVSTITLKACRLVFLVPGIFYAAAKGGFVAHTTVVNVQGQEQMPYGQEQPPGGNTPGQAGDSRMQGFGFGDDPSPSQVTYPPLPFRDATNSELIRAGTARQHAVSRRAFRMDQCASSADCQLGP